MQNHPPTVKILLSFTTQTVNRMVSAIFIPLPYRCLSKPTYSDGQILHDSSPGEFWRVCDTEEGADDLVVDSLPELRRAAQSVNKQYENAEDGGELLVIVEEDRVAQNVISVGVFSPSPALVNQERATMLRAYQPVTVKSVPVRHRSELFSQLFPKLDEISAYSGAAIVVTDFNAEKMLASKVGDEFVYVNLYGSLDAVTDARKLLNVSIDCIFSNLYVDTFDLLLSVQSLVAGVRNGNIKTIEDHARVKFYMAEPLSELYSTASPCGEVTRNLNQIYITARDPANIELAKALLQEVVKRTTPLVHKDCVVSFVKIDFLIFKCVKELKKIMTDLGTFIQLPYLGASRSLVRVLGVNAWSVEATIRELMKLTSNFYNVSYMLHTGQRDPNDETFLDRPNIDIPMPHRISASNVSDLGDGALPKYSMCEALVALDRIAVKSGATIGSTFGSTYEIAAYKTDAKKAASLMASLAHVKQYETQIVYRLELELEQKDFIAGKKSGKTHRIMKNSNVWIRFLPFNEYNFYVSLEADNFTNAQSGIQLLEDEFPAEVCFYIPEMFHKQVIGQGGQRIQGIMRKYNVFVKFSNDHEDYPNAFSLEEPDNVLIRCPSKNNKNIADAQRELMSTVDERSTDLCNTFIHMSRSHRRIFVEEKATSIRNIESKTSSVILLPGDIINAPDGVVEVQGLAATSADCTRMLKTLLPEDYEFKIAFSNTFAEVCTLDSGDFYSEIVVPFRVALHIEVEVYQQPRNPTGSSIPASSMVTTHNTATPEKMPSKYHRIVLSYSSENSVGLEDAIQALTSFLRSKNLNILDRGEIHGDPVEEGSAATVGQKRKTEFFNSRNPAFQQSAPLVSAPLAPPPQSYGAHPATFHPDSFPRYN